jgi:hypothetical protein
MAEPAFKRLLQLHLYRCREFNTNLLTKYSRAFLASTYYQNHPRIDKRPWIPPAYCVPNTPIADPYCVGCRAYGNIQVMHLEKEVF